MQLEPVTQNDLGLRTSLGNSFTSRSPQSNNIPNEASDKKRNEGIKTLIRYNEDGLALDLIRSGLYTNSNDIFLLKSLAEVSKRTQKEDLHFQSVQSICRLEPSFKSFYDLGFAYYILQKDEEATESLEKALMYPSTNKVLIFETYKLLGNLSVKAKDLEAAYEFYSKAWSLNDKSDVLHVNLGTLMVQKNDLSAAADYFRKALEMNPQNDKAWVGLALNHQRLGDFVLAQANIENALEIAPGNRTAVQIAVSLGIPELKYQWVSQFLQNYLYEVQSDSEISILLIHVLVQMGQRDLAKLECERALLFEPTNELLLSVINELC